MVPAFLNIRFVEKEIGFFHESVSPKAPEYTIRAVSKFLKIRGDIRSSRLTTGINDTGGKQCF
jgi:hypothetical protein